MRLSVSAWGLTAASVERKRAACQPRSGVRMQPTAQAAGRVEKKQISPGGAKDGCYSPVVPETFPGLVNRMPQRCRRERYEEDFRSQAAGFKDGFKDE